MDENRAKTQLGQQRQEIEGELGNDPCVKAMEEELREWINFDLAVELLALYMVAYERTQQDIDSIMESADRIAAAGKHATESARGLDAIATESTAVAIKMAKQLITIKTKASQRGKSAANDLHGRPGGSRDKQAAIRAAWATGKYKSRDVCAEEECAALNMAFGTARKALRNTPEPLRRCTA